VRLRSSVALGLVLLPLVLLCVRLGQWQLQRMQEKQLLLDRFEHATEVDLQQALAKGSQFAHVRVSGHYYPGWHLLLDNKTLGGRVGVHVLSLFVPDHGQPVLVNRGWLPLSENRSVLPEVPTPSGHLSISGILNNTDAGGLRLGEPDSLTRLTGTRLITYLDINALVAATGIGISNWLIQLDAADSTGFEGRNWQPTVILPAQHGAYAIQWFGLAVALTVTWIVLVCKWRHPTRHARTSRPGNLDQNEP